jgi:hypothetical protein
MANRHQRRKRAMLKAAYFAQLTDEQRRSLEVSKIVERNLASPRPERSFAPSSVALVQQSHLGASKRSRRRVAPYTKHSAGDTPMPANYPLDKRLSEMGERRLVTERVNDRRFESPAVHYPIVERD